MPNTPPSTRWYRAAGVIATLGIVAAFAWWGYASTRVHDTVYGFAHTSPFGGRVELPGGQHTLWLEGDCLSCHDNSPDEYREVATIDIRDPNGDPVAVRPADDGWLYNTGSREGRALYVFDVTEPGAHSVRFALDTSAVEWDNAMPARLAFGRGAGLPVAIVRPIVGLAGAGILVAVGLTAVTMVRRRRFFDRRYQDTAR